MASTYSPNLRIELIGTGDQAGTWGNTTNATDQYVLESAISGYQSVTINSAAQALTYVYGSTTSSTANQSIFAFLQLTAGTVTTAFSIYAPPTPKSYVIYNNTAYTATIYNSTAIGNTTPAGLGVTLAAGATITVWSDGTNFRGSNTASAGNFLIEGNLSVLGNDTEIGNFAAAGILYAFEQATFTGSISGYTLTVPTGGVSVGQLFVGQIITGSGITAATTNTLTTPLSTTSGSAVVTVTQPGHGFTTGTPVTISGASSTGGIPSTNLNGTFNIVVTGLNTYTYTAGVAATSSVSGGGGTITVSTPDTQITALGSGTGGAGTYLVNISQTAASTTITGKPASITSTPASTDNSNNVATTAFVKSALAASGSFVYPNAGIPNSTGAAWGTSYSSSNPIPANLGGTGLTSPSTANNALVSTGSGWTSSPIVNSIAAGTGISITGSGGSYTISQSGSSGVSSINNGGNITLSGSTGPVTISLTSGNVIGALGYTPVSPSTLSSYASLTTSSGQAFAGTIYVPQGISTGTGPGGGGLGLFGKAVNFDTYSSVFYSSGQIQFSVSSSSFNAVLLLDPNNVYLCKQTIPNADNAYSMGWGGGRWTQIYAVSNTINTSDANEKTEIADLDEAEKRVATRIKGLIKKFKWKDSVTKKGSDGARIHVGVIAQEVGDAFTTEGLDPHRYGMFCYDEWDAADEIIGQDGSIVVPAREAGSRYGVRYEQLLAFIISAL